MADITIGIDIGSTWAKGAVLAGDTVLHTLARPTGWSSVNAARALGADLLTLGFDPAQLPAAATGYGRGAVDFADKQVTEITCHARGASFLHGAGDLTILDIGGQDTKIIQTAGGAVTDFLMNDKCSAGTGRFLDIMARTLEVDTPELCRLAAQGGGVTISSMCTVFAESEVISLIGRGESRENIAYAVVDSIVTRVVTQAGRLLTPGAAVCLTGGLCGMEDLRQALETALKRPVLTHPLGQFAGAVGAALSARTLTKNAP